MKENMKENMNVINRKESLILNIERSMNVILYKKEDLILHIYTIYRMNKNQVFILYFSIVILNLFLKFGDLNSFLLYYSNEFNDESIYLATDNGYMEINPSDKGSGFYHNNPGGNSGSGGNGGPNNSSYYYGHNNDNDNDNSDNNNYGHNNRSNAHRHSHRHEHDYQPYRARNTQSHDNTNSDERTKSRMSMSYLNNPTEVSESNPNINTSEVNTTATTSPTTTTNTTSNINTTKENLDNYTTKGKIQSKYFSSFPRVSNKSSFNNLVEVDKDNNPYNTRSNPFSTENNPYNTRSSPSNIRGNPFTTRSNPFSTENNPYNTGNNSNNPDIMQDIRYKKSPFTHTNKKIFSSLTEQSADKIQYSSNNMGKNPFLAPKDPNVSYTNYEPTSKSTETSSSSIFKNIFQTDIKKSEDSLLKKYLDSLHKKKCDEPGCGLTEEQRGKIEQIIRHQLHEKPSHPNRNFWGTEIEKDESLREAMKRHAHHNLDSNYRCFRPDAHWTTTVSTKTSVELLRAFYSLTRRGNNR